jgi:SAM-dependent methyltransferase
LSILVVGCGNQTQQLERHFAKSNATFMFCDIDKKADVDVFCDAHQLPLKNESFDGLITTAVLEHVLYPEKVVSEMVRVLKLGGFIYSEIPFLQSVHEGAYDFTRYTMSGHRRLLEHFDEVDAGMVAGPATALLWALCDLPRGLFTSPRISQLATIVIRCLFFWIKYLDVLMKHNQKALDFSCATYYWGNKAEHPVSAESIVKKYGASSFSHV